MTVEHFDVVVVGAGISGIGAGYHLQTMSPNRSYVILEGRDDIGGTWDLFRYPGVRSDSDMHTLGYSFKPWTHGSPSPTGRRSCSTCATPCEFGIDRHIRFGHQMASAEWSSENNQWTVHGHHRNGDPVTFSCGYLFMCSGYYSYRGGYLPDPWRRLVRGRVDAPTGVAGGSGLRRQARGGHRLRRHCDDADPRDG